MLLFFETHTRPRKRSSPHPGSDRVEFIKKDSNIFQVEEFPQSYFAKSPVVVETRPRAVRVQCVPCTIWNNYSKITTENFPELITVIVVRTEFREFFPAVFNASVGLWPRLQFKRGKKNFERRTAISFCGKVLSKRLFKRYQCHN